jgi:hypothetical protein
VVTRGALVTSEDGGVTFSPPLPLHLDTRERPAIAPLGDSLLLAYRTPRGAILAQRLGQAPWLVTGHSDHAPWAVESSFDQGAVYVFSTDHNRVRYHKIGRGGLLSPEPVEIPGAGTRSGGAAAPMPGQRLVLTHDAGSGMFIRFFDPEA